MHYRCDEQADWFPDLADVEAKIARRARAVVVLTNPNNPTEFFYSAELLHGLTDIAAATS